MEVRSREIIPEDRYIFTVFIFEKMEQSRWYLRMGKHWGVVWGGVALLVAVLASAMTNLPWFALWQKAVILAIAGSLSIFVIIYGIVMNHRDAQKEKERIKKQEIPHEIIKAAETYREMQVGLALGVSRWFLNMVEEASAKQAERGSPSPSQVTADVPLIPRSVTLDNIGIVRAWLGNQASNGRTIQSGLVAANKAEKIEEIHQWIEHIAQRLQHNLSGQIRNDWFNCAAFPRHNVHSWDASRISAHMTERIGWLERFKGKVYGGNLASHFNRAEFE